MKLNRFAAKILLSLSLIVLLAAAGFQPAVASRAAVVPGSFSKLTPKSVSLVGTTVTLTWSSAKNALSYEYCLAQTLEDCDKNWTNVGSLKKVVLTSLPKGTTFYWHVRAVNGADLTYSNGSDTSAWYFIIPNDPGAFTKDFPADGSQAAVMPDLLWHSSAGAVSYQVCINTIAAPCKKWTSTTSNFLETKKLKEGTTYYWQARAINISGVTYADGSDTEYYSFTYMGKMKMISTGDYHACVVTGLGGVKCWGDNSAGQLGTGNNDDASEPVDVPGLTSGVIAVSAGGNNTCALTVLGGVKCWGWGTLGELGNGSKVNSNVPVDVTGLTSGVKSISVGSYNTACALTIDGVVKCWGYNEDYEIGDGTNENRFEPVTVLGLPAGIKAVSAGGYHTCALTKNNGVMCWGDNGSGELGNGTHDNALSPNYVTGLTSGVKSINAGYGVTCALTTSGAVKCWGDNGYGYVGNGTSNVEELTPQNVLLPSGKNTALSTNSNSCAIHKGGALYCWGINTTGELGNGTTDVSSNIPVIVAGLNSGVDQVSAGGYFSCAITGQGGVKCWGDNTYGELGNGTNVASNVPVDVNGFGVFTDR